VIFSNSTKILAVYLLIEYLVPSVLISQFEVPLVFRLADGSPYTVAVFWVYFCAAMLGVFGSSFFRAPSRAENFGSEQRLERICQLVLLTFCVINITGAILGISSWRYEEAEVGSSRLLSSIAISHYLGPFLCMMLLYFRARVLCNDKLVVMSTTRMLIVVYCLTAINGISSALFAAVTVPLVLFPSVFLPFFWRLPNRSSVSGDAFLKGILSVPIVLIAGLFLLNSGIQVKRGADADVTLASGIFSVGFPYITARNSVHYAQGITAVSDAWDAENIAMPLRNTAYRIDSLFGGVFNIQEPEVGTYSRKALIQFANYENINPKGGSSPGVIAAHAMSFPVGFGLIFIMAHLFLVGTFLSLLFDDSVRLSLFGSFYFAYFFIGYILAAPFEVFAIGPQLLITMSMIGIALARLGLFYSLFRYESGEDINESA
jgi:hypothetical protein